MISLNSLIQSLTFVLCTSFFLGTFAYAEEKLPKELRGVEVKQKLGARIDLTLPFVDHKGKERTLKSYFADNKPVLLTLNYYNCPMLCTIQLNSLVDAMKKLPKGYGKNFRFVTVSINHREDAKLAAAKRKNYLKQLKRKDIEWEFMTGKKKHIEVLSKTVGFKYRYLPKKKQYLHPAVVFFVTPDGKVSQYLGLPYVTRDVKFALVTASKGRLGSIFEKLIMSCFIYNSTDGQYTPYAYGIVRLSGVLTVIVLAIMLLLFWTRERQRVEKMT